MMALAFSGSALVTRLTPRTHQLLPHQRLCTCSAEVVPLQLPTLIPALVVGRPNRFIFETVVPSVGTEVVESHSPATGKIRGSGGILKFQKRNPVRALVIPAPEESVRRTRYTVVALDIGAGGANEARWCGIHQTHSNHYLAHFLEQGAIPEVLPPGSTLRREVTAPDGRSRIDIVGTTPEGREIWIENKTMLGSLPVSPDNPAFSKGPVKKAPSLSSPDRMLKHWNTLSSLAAEPDIDAIVVFTYLTNAPKFVPPEPPTTGGEGPVEKHYRIVRAASDTRKAGVRFVQVNLQLTLNSATGVAEYSLGDVINLD